MAEYQQGNIQEFLQKIQTSAPRVYSLITRTVEPIIFASMVNLMGSSDKFHRYAGEATLTVVENVTKEVHIAFTYFVPDFAGYVGDSEAIAEDSAFILRHCQSVSEVQWGSKSVQIDTKLGLVQVAFTIPLQG